MTKYFTDECFNIHIIIKCSVGKYSSCKLQKFGQLVTSVFIIRNMDIVRYCI